MHPRGFLRSIQYLLALEVIQPKLIDLLLLFLLLYWKPYFVGSLPPSFLVIVGYVRSVTFVLGLRLLGLDHVLNVKLYWDAFVYPQHFLLLFNTLLNPSLFLLSFFSLFGDGVRTRCCNTLAQRFKVQCVAILPSLVVFVLCRVLYNCLPIQVQ